jgi:hypothetical protein
MDSNTINLKLDNYVIENQEEYKNEELRINNSG